jgi:hypothetical protein
LILSLHSNKFQAQFTGQLLDATRGKLLVIEDPITRYNAFKFLLTYLYTGQANFAFLKSLDDWSSAAHIADEHMLSCLKTHLEKHILQNRFYVTIHTVCHLIGYAQLFHMPYLVKYCKRYAQQSQKAISALPEFAELEEATVLVDSFSLCFSYADIKLGTFWTRGFRAMESPQSQWPYFCGKCSRRN